MKHKETKDKRHKEQEETKRETKRERGVGIAESEVSLEAVVSNTDNRQKERNDIFLIIPPSHIHTINMFVYIFHMYSVL